MSSTQVRGVFHVCMGRIPGEITRKTVLVMPNVGFPYEVPSEATMPGAIRVAYTLTDPKLSQLRAEIMELAKTSRTGFGVFVENESGELRKVVGTTHNECGGIVPVVDESGVFVALND